MDDAIESLASILKSTHRRVLVHSPEQVDSAFTKLERELGDVLELAKGMKRMGRMRRIFQRNSHKDKAITCRAQIDHARRDFEVRTEQFDVN